MSHSPTDHRRLRTHPSALTFAVMAGLLASGCATNPVTGGREFVLMSESQEIQTGQQLDQEVRKEMGVYEDRALQQYVEDIGLRLAKNSHRPALPWHFTIVDAPAVNAFALPGGYVYITRGILPFLHDEAQLAGVIGHEIGHVTARHAVRQYTKATGAGLGLLLGGIFVPATRPFGQLAESGLGLLFLKYGRDDELEADRLGTQYESQTGWDPKGVPGMLTTLGRIDEATDRRGVPNWLSTHPDPGDRVQRIQPVVQQIESTAPSRPWTTDHDGFLRRIDGLMYGDNPREGVVRGSAFLHRDLRIAVQFPDGWDVVNGPTQVMAQEPGSEVYLLMQLVEKPAGRTIEEIALRQMEGAGFRRLEGSATKINGLDAHVGRYQGSLEGLGRVTMRAAHIAHDRNVFLLGGFAQESLYGRAEPDFNRSIGRFRALTPAEAEDIRPNRLDLYVVRPGDTWQAIAQRAGSGVIRASLLAIMNSYPVNEQPRVGERIKIVVPG